MVSIFNTLLLVCYSYVFSAIKQGDSTYIFETITLYFFLQDLINSCGFFPVYYLTEICPISQCNECFTNVLQAPEWTEEDLSQLTRSMVKFPGGTPGRWEKIAHELGRSVADVSSLRFAL